MFAQHVPLFRAMAIGGTMLAIALTAADAARAAGGPSVTLPNAGITNKSGLRISVDGRGVDGNGYRPVRVTVSPVPLVPLTADRQIRVVLKPYERTAVGTAVVSQIIDLPEGSTSVEATILVPQTAQWYSLSIETWEGGEKWNELSTPYVGWQNSGWEWTEARPVMWVIDRDAPLRSDREAAVQLARSQGLDPTPTHDLPDVRTLARMFPDPNNSIQTTTVISPSDGSTPKRVTDVDMLSQLHDFSRFEVISTDEVPPRWIEMSQVDVTVISLDDLAHLAREQPLSLAALRDWLASGSLLMVYGVGDDFQRLAELERLLQLPPLAARPDQPAAYRGWTVPTERDKNQGQLKTLWDEYGTTWTPYGGAQIVRQKKAVAKRGGDTNRADSDPGEAASEAAQPAARPPFVLRTAHFGSVVALGPENPFPGNEAAWAWIFNSASDNQWQWYQRNGFSLHRKNDDYWRFLIPGVGEAPIVSFLLLVSLFAVVIGPVNYILLNRGGRLYLLLITVPAGAAVITVSLFAYALLTDGLGVRLRARSFTELDQRTGQAAAWSRQSYYAAVAPSGGLAFPDDAVVFPIVYQPSMSRSQNEIGRLEWDGGQRLRAGYLPSRTASQFMVQRATHTEAKLIVAERGAGPPAVENRLDTTIRFLLLRDSAGNYYTASSIKPGDKPALKPTDPAAAEQELRALYGGVEPALPRGYDPNLHNNVFTSLLPNYSWMSVDSASSMPSMAMSLLESNLAAASVPTKRPLDPGTYIAVVAASPVVPIGVPRVREEASLHVIRGRW